MAASLVSLLAAGCATDQQTTRAQGAGAGAVIGATLGALLGHREGAAIGAAVGAGAGYAYGDHVARQKQAYTEREQQLRAAAADAARSTEEARAANEEIEAELDGLKQTRDRLINERMAAVERRRLTAEQQQKVGALLDRTEQQIAGIDRQLAQQRAAMKNEQQLAQQSREAPVDGLKLVAAGVNDLETERIELERLHEQLRLIDPRRAY